MEIQAVITFADLAFAALERLAPHIEQAIRNGQISKEDQQKHRALFDYLNAQNFRFTRPDGSGSPT